MRWEHLFEDLEAQADAAAASGADLEVRELAGAERTRITLLERLQAGSTVTIGDRAGELHTGAVLDVGRDWLLLQEARRTALIPLGAIAWLEGASRVGSDRASIARTIGLAHVLRGLSDQEQDVVVMVGERQMAGTIEFVGADHVELRGEQGALVSLVTEAIGSLTF